MSRIFISYRRNDSQDIAGRVHGSLTDYFGPDAVFFDETITYGDHFRNRLLSESQQCTVFLAIIGPKWLDACHADGPRAGERRLDDPDDYVRLEVETVLQRPGDSARFYPVLVGWASVPKPKELPSTIRDLAYHQAIEVRSGRDYQGHMDRLIREIEPYVGRPDREHAPRDPKVIPKGLCAFDASDAKFFLQLLPPPYDLQGVPESIRFWKTRIDETDPDMAFPVGLMYGPSGSGKSSLVQAGLRPRLAEHVLSIYDMASAERTERRLVRKLRAASPDLPADADLTECFAALVRGECLPPGKRKVVVFLDQFEQWLHVTPEPRETALFEALSHCDGRHLQCVVLVRDEYYAAVVRFLESLGIDLLTGHNMASVDLFDESHARKVLQKFGVAYERLPADANEFSAKQVEFLDQAVAGLSHQRKVVPVHLALFAEMVKDRPWTSTTMKKVEGEEGAEGVGIAFLDEKMDCPTANPQLARHLDAMVRILAALLPPLGADIKGERRSLRELHAASELSERTDTFEGILRVLVTELRLITPTTADEVDADDQEKYYQLTHDYLVPSLRKWLTRKLKDTWRGRAELRLTERAASWNAKPENRHLPAWWEYLDIRLLTSRGRWTQPQQRMMRRAAKVHGVRWGTGLLLVLLIGITIQQILSTSRLRQIKTAITAMGNSQAKYVPQAVRDLDSEEFPRETMLDQLRASFSEGDESQKLPLACALAHFGEVNVEFLISQIGGASGEDVNNLVTALGHGKQRAVQQIQTAVGNVSESQEVWRHKARLAIVAMYLGELGPAADMLEFENRLDPIQRTVFIETFFDWHGNLQLLQKLVAHAAHPGLRSGICLAAGSVEDVGQETKGAWQPLLA